MATHNLRLRQIIITRLSLLLHCCRRLFLYIILFSIFLSILFLFTVVYFLMLQLLPYSCSQHHIADEGIFRRCLSIGALPLPFSILLLLSSFSLALFLSFFSTFPLSLCSLVMLKINLHQHYSIHGKQQLQQMITFLCLYRLRSASLSLKQREREDKEPQARHARLLMNEKTATMTGGRE